MKNATNRATKFTRRRNCRTSSARPTTTRKEFLLQVAGITAAPLTLAAQPSAASPKVLIVVAHPDDEYAFAATVYRITNELGGSVDQLVLTNGEGGFRYSRLAEAYYGLPLTREDIGRSRLPAIRKDETLRAGRILGIRHHWFLHQKDARFTLDGDEAFKGIWDVNAIRDRVARLCRSERYDFVLALLPTVETHGHHQAAALIVLQTISKLEPDVRPVVLGSEPSDESSLPKFERRSDIPLMRLADTPVHRVSRMESFGPGGSLNYNITVNWVIAEHKSQGLFQTEYGKHSHENFWVFDTKTPDATTRANALFERLGARRSTR